MGPARFHITRWAVAASLAIGSAGAAAFGPELVKTVLPSQGQVWWFLGLTVLATAVIGVGLWQRRKVAEADNVGIVVAAIDPGDETRGRTLWENAREYAESNFVTSVAPFMERLPADRKAAAAQVDGLGDRVNELIGFAARLAPSASRFNILLVLRNAAAFRLGMKLGRQHRKPIVVHHSDSAGTFPASRLADLDGVPFHGLTDSPVTVPGGAGDRGCLLLNLQGRGQATLDKAVETCAALGVGRIVEVRHGSNTLSRDQTTFEGVVQRALKA